MIDVLLKIAEWEVIILLVAAAIFGHIVIAMLITWIFREWQDERKLRR